MHHTHSDVFIRLRHYVTSSWVHAAKSYYDQGAGSDKKAVMQKVSAYLFAMLYQYIL